MDAREAAKLKMYETFNTFLEQEQPVFVNYKPMVSKYGLFRESLTRVNELAKTLSNDNTGYSKDKKSLKVDMAESIATLAGVAQVAFEEKEMQVEAQQMHVSVSDYLRLSDVEAKVLAEAQYEILVAHKALLVPDFITEEELSSAGSLINSFHASTSSGALKQQSSPTETQNFKKTIKYKDKLVEDIRLLARKLGKTNPDFYERLLAVSTLPPVAVHHTYFSVTLLSKETKQPIANATASLSNTKKTGISDESGNLNIEQVRQGTATLHIKAEGYKELNIKVSIQRSRDNHFDLELEAL